VKDVAIVGAGPGGSLLAYRLVRAGVAVTIFDASHPREKPCGGGVTGKALALLPPAPADDPLPARWLDSCDFDSGAGDSVRLGLSHPVAVCARRDLDAWLLRQAVSAGARHIAQRITMVDAAGLVRSAEAEHHFDVIVGADGAGSLVRRTFVSAVPPERLVMAAGWFARGTSTMRVQFTPGLPGYLWLFPRLDHVGVGICAPLGSVPTRDMLGRLEAEAIRHFPALVDDEAGRYAHTIPSPTADPASILEIAGQRWALIGDAAALADPITGEGIYGALRSATILAETLQADGSTDRYPERCLEDFGRDLLRAAALRARFYRPGFARRMIAYAARSSAIRSVLADLVLGEQGYVGLRRRLLRAGPRFVWDTALARLLHDA
jgi:geranylgeranyl diphosphate/geranylgeranyl-bacteriochlorophyllide a reductase